MRPRKIVGIIAAAVILACLGYILWLPNTTKLKRQNPKETALMSLRKKQARERGKPYAIRKEWASYENISPHLVHAVIVSEDGNFWRHDGLDFEQIQEAVETNFKRGRFVYGASTITQQLAKNLYLSPAKNPLRKIKEALIAKKLEKQLTKRRILELYLNVVEWGPGVFGAEAAARHYFGKQAAELNAEESARLAAYLPSPIRYGRLKDSPYLARTARKILFRMKARGWV